MKKKIVAGLGVMAITAGLLVGCNGNYMAKNFGGTMTVKLEPNQKLVNATWKDDNLWYLTKPMKADEQAETLTFEEQTEFGMIEGKVIFIESKQ